MTRLVFNRLRGEVIGLGTFPSPESFRTKQGNACKENRLDGLREDGAIVKGKGRPKNNIGKPLRKL